MTDAPSGRELVEKTFVYMTSLGRECRKALTVQFEQVHKGLPFDSIEPIMRREIEAWFTQRDKKIKVTHEKSSAGKPGELLITYLGATKDAHFKFHVNSSFTLTGSEPKASSYLKSVNVHVDKRDFTK